MCLSFGPVSCFDYYWFFSSSSIRTAASINSALYWVKVSCYFWRGDFPLWTLESDDVLVMHLLKCPEKHIVCNTVSYYMQSGMGSISDTCI